MIRDSSPGAVAPVSVVIPAYNSGEFLEETVASVYSQTITPAEVIVVNDGSTDDTEDRLRRLASSLPASFNWLTKPNGGEASARNVALKLATQFYVAFLDHDDVWRPTKLERQLGHFESDPELALSFTGYTVSHGGPLEPHGRDDGPQEVVHHDSWDPDPDRLLNELVRGVRPIKTMSTVLIRRDALARITPFDEGLVIGTDVQMYMKFAVARMKMDYLPDALVEYRWHGANFSRDAGLVLEHTCELYDKFFSEHAIELPEDVRKRARWWRARWHLFAAIDAIQHGDTSRARRHILTAARIRPLSVRPGWMRMLGVGAPPR